MSDIKNVLENLSGVVNAYLSTTEKHVNALQAPFHAQALEEQADSISELAGQLIVIGDQAQELLSQGEAIAYGIHFRWIEEAKQILVLWRDTLFQYQKARILQKEGRLEDEEIRNLHHASKEVLSAAVKDQGKAFEELNRLLNSPRSAKRKIAEWRLLNSPWPIYKEQIEDLGRQPYVLIKQYYDLLEVSDSMITIDGLIENIATKGKNGIENILTLSQEAVDIITNTQDSKKRIFELESIEQLIKAAPSFESYNEDLDAELDNYNSNLQFPITTQGGIIKYKDLNPARQIRQWLEGEIHPALNDTIEISENTNSAFKMALVNTRNRILLHIQEGEEKAPLSPDELIQPIQDAIIDIRSWRSDYKSIRNTIISRMKTYFFASQIYNLKREFLPLSYTSSLSQFNIDENPWLTNLKAWILQKTRFLQDVKTTVLKEESLSDAERIVRFVKSRRSLDDQHQYDSIFTAEGYIGESFCIGRAKETEQIIGLINDWRAGFRGAVVLHGMRFAGKSLFGEMIAQRYFHNDTIALKPNSTISVLGRRITLSYDLEEGLEFVSKYAANQDKLIWIDDLELWNSEKISINKNVEALMNHIDRYDHRFFYMVAMNSWSVSHFNEMFGLNQALEARINLNRMSLMEVREALAIRHGATHKKMVNHDGEELVPREFAKYTSEIFRLSNGNIGESLRLWACASEVVNEEEVRISSLPLYELPDFIDADRGILLRTLLQQKQSNEYRMLKQFGPAFSKRYKVIIQRMLSYGILQRQGNGLLSISPGVVNEVARMLEQRGHIQISIAR